jgi:adenylate cyclase class 2
MSFEVEVKYRSVDHDLLRRRLGERGAAEEPAVVQEDIYLSHPARDFAQTNEALRLRRIGAENRITYKGPRRAGPTKTREEIEIPVAPGDEAFQQLARLFANLGFRPVATIRKTRSIFHLTDRLQSIAVALDRAEGLGDFAEIEVVAATESDLPAAQAVVLGLADELGLTAVEPRSYLRLALEARQPLSGPGPAPGDGHAATDPRAVRSRSDPPQTG